MLEPEVIPIHKSRSQQLYATSLKPVTPFSTTTSQPFAISPPPPSPPTPSPSATPPVPLLPPPPPPPPPPPSPPSPRLGVTGDPSHPRSILLSLANNDEKDIPELFPSDHNTTTLATPDPRLPTPYRFLSCSTTL